MTDVLSLQVVLQHLLMGHPSKKQLATLSCLARTSRGYYEIARSWLGRAKYIWHKYWPKLARAGLQKIYSRSTYPPIMSSRSLLTVTVDIEYSRALSYGPDGALFIIVPTAPEIIFGQYPDHTIGLSGISFGYSEKARIMVSIDGTALYQGLARNYARHQHMQYAPYIIDGTDDILMISTDGELTDLRFTYIVMEGEVPPFEYTYEKQGITYLPVFSLL